jgi:hypothetical protein
MIPRILVAAGLALQLGSAEASTITDRFSFVNASNTVIASGAFSYDSSHAGTLGYSDLSAFSITVFGQPFDLTFVNSLVGNPSAYVYFKFDPSSGKFVPGIVTGYDAPFSGILAATTGYDGFAISPLRGQADPAHTGADGQTTAYNPFVTDFAVTSVAAIPEPSTWIMMLLGMFGVGVVGYRRSRRDIVSGQTRVA